MERSRRHWLGHQRWALVQLKKSLICSLLLGTISPCTVDRDIELGFIAGERGHEKAGIASLVGVLSLADVFFVKSPISKGRVVAVNDPWGPKSENLYSELNG